MRNELKVQHRTVTGTNQAKKLRAQRQIPGVIYSRGAETKNITVDAVDFLKTYREAGSSAVIYLDLEGQEEPVLIREVQMDPIKENEFIHVDFLKLDMTEKIRLNIPVVLLNRENIAIQPSVLMQLVDEIEVECLPTYIPQTADIDVSDIDLDTPKLVSDADVANMEEVEVLTDLDDVVATLSLPMEEEEEEELEEEISADDVPVIGEDGEGEEEEEEE